MKTWITGDIFNTEPAQTTLKAWEPWYLCRGILFELQNSDVDAEHPEWRIHWIAGVAMLRSIGHVLHKVDGVRSPETKRLIEGLWSSWSKNRDDHWIFFDFIEKERNNILKNFSFGADLPSTEDGRLLAYGSTDFDASQLFREAVYWWRTQLTEIEDRLAPI